MINSSSIITLLESFMNEEKKVIDVLSKEEIPVKDIKEFAVSNKCETDNWCSVADMKKFLKSDATTKSVKLDAIKADDNAFALYDDGSGPKWYPIQVK